MILVEVDVPALGRIYDMELDENVRAEVLIREIVTVICQKEHCQCFEDRARIGLYSRDGACRLELERTLPENGVKDGHCLILV